MELNVFFYKSKFENGYMWVYSHASSNKKINYIELISKKETQDVLKKDLKVYLKKISKTTLTKCS